MIHLGYLQKICHHKVMPYLTRSLTRIGILAGCLGIIFIVGHWTLEFSSFYQQPIGKRFSELWARDVSMLKAAHIFPPGIFDLKSYELSAATERTQSWKPDISIPFGTDPNGHFHLEILLLSWEEGSKEGAIVQYNLIDMRSKDMTWELGRTFVLLGQNPIEEAIARQILKLFYPINSQPTP